VFAATMLQLLSPERRYDATGFPWKFKDRVVLVSRLAARLACCFPVVHILRIIYLLQHKVAAEKFTT
jgi:hypothetical protein